MTQNPSIKWTTSARLYLLKAAHVKRLRQLLSAVNTPIILLHTAAMQRLLRFTTGSFLVAQCPSEQKSFVAEILDFFDAGLLASSRPLRITSFMT